jgi:glycosyltransferase involved in cell wall biosynthesis
MPWANWQATVYHGLPEDLHRFHPEPGRYLAFLGRICPEKRVDRAIAIAKRAGIELKIAAKVDAADQEYFEPEIRHLLDDPLVDFIGEIGEGQKEAFLGGAAALLMPIGWPEPFGLVVIEAMACGTPVIAFPFGSMPELIEPGVNGALVDSVDQAVAVVEALAALDRRLCRRSFEERFTAPLMAKNYVRVYEELVEEPVSSLGRSALPEQGYPDPGSCVRGGRRAAVSAWPDQAGVNGSRPR